MRKLIRSTATALTGILLFASSFARAQSADITQPGTDLYHSALGVRFGTDLGITYRTQFHNNYFEGILGSGYRGLLITGLYEKFQPAAPKANLYWFYGAGGHIGFFDRPHSYNYYYYDRWGNYYVEHVYGYPGPTFGIDGILGLEYKFRKLPFAASIDLKPYLDLFRFGYGYIDGAFTFRYTF